MSKPAPDLSRRRLLGAISAAPVLAVSPWRDAIAALPYRDEPLALRRTRKGRSESRFRYHNAEGFFRGVENGVVRIPSDALYQIGIVQQLGLSSHLLDVGFSDAWCARNIGLQVAKSLAYANATGFGFASSEFEQLATLISPYCKWRLAGSCGCHQLFTADRIRALTRELLDHVHRVTGHPRPAGWHRRVA